jgi:hypothetical protein
MRKTLLFVSAVAMVATGLWLLHAESFSADIIFGAAALTTFGFYLLWTGAAAWSQSGKLASRWPRLARFIAS